MTKLLSLSALLAAALFSAPSSAMDVYPGSTCQAVGQNGNAINYTDRGQAANATGLTIRVVCPLTRENPIELFQNVKVVVADRHTTQNITCEAFSAQADGAGYAQSRSSAQYSPEWFQSETLSIPPTGFNSPAGTYYVVCSLPPVQNGKQSWIASYSVAEKCLPGRGATDYYPIAGEGRHAHGVTTIDCE